MAALVASSQDLDFRLDFSLAGYGLRVHVTGTNGTLQTSLAYWQGIAAEVRRVRPARLLVVDDMDGEPPPPDQLLQLVQHMRGQGLDEVRIAYVEKDAVHIPQMELAAILANEHGFDARVFDNEAAALLWLRYGER
jgi:hypothetical protein